MKAYRIISEWDVGEENVIFLKKEKALEWLTKNKYIIEIYNDDINNDDNITIDHYIKILMDEGLLDIEQIELID